MRLLECKPDGEPIFRECTNKDVPAYAILSHTWTTDNNEEVSFQDLEAGVGKSKAGYKKIQFCAEKAAADGLRYFWIDTCCINRANFTELSEAINSMFRWYHEATRCYVYLSDVPDPKDPTSTVESAFPYSRWFTRGWTLQELIAPASVQFFSRKGELLGSKRSREQQIHQVTGIAIGALRGNPLSEFSIDERLSWATGRETKIEEDAAYCLLGIFNIHIPLIYGEGRQNALDRLRRKFHKFLLQNSLEPLSPPAVALQTLEGHSFGVAGVAFSPDGKQLASASIDRTVKLWDARSWTALHTLEGHSIDVWGVAFSPNSKLLASASADHTVRLWDARSGAALHKLKGHSHYVYKVAFSIDSKLLWSSSADHTIRLWDARSGVALHTLEGHSGDVCGIALSPDGNLLASASADHTVRLWDARSSAVLHTLKGHTNYVWGVAFSLDSKLLWSSSVDRTIKLWDARSGAALQTLEGHSGDVKAVVLSPNGKLLASASTDDTVRLWDAGSGEPLQMLEGHSSFVNSIAFSPDGKLLASAAQDHTVRLWNIRS